MLKRILPVLPILLFSTFFGTLKAVASAPAAGDTIYVDLSATGANDGTSWTNAYKDLQTAISIEPDNKIFLVAKGTYYPGTILDPSLTFSLKNGQQLFGGFPTGGSDFSQRNRSTNVTVLSGDQNKNGVSENGIDSYVVVSFLTISGTPRIDGFTITGAENTGAQGGGIFIQNTDAVICHNIIENNVADDGAGIYSVCFFGQPSIYKNAIRRNSSVNNGKGGGMYIEGPAHVYTNVISKNYSVNGGGIYCIEAGYTARFVNNTVACNYGGIKGILYTVQSGGVALFHNNIIWYNEFSYNSSGVTITDPTPSSSRNNITEVIVLNNVNGNKKQDPRLVDTANGDFSLQRPSNAIESADSNLLAIVTTDTTDFAGNTRYFDADFNGSKVLDIGAYESLLVFEPCTTNAGPDNAVCALLYTLGAKQPGFMRTGEWTQVSGPGVATFTNTSSPTSTVVVSVQGTYTLRWTMTGNFCTIADDVVIKFYSPPTANAGRDTSSCEKTSNLAAVNSTGTGTWSAVEAGVTITNNTLTNTSVTVPNYGVYHFVWLETNGSCTSDDDTVTITFFKQPVANAGTDVVACGLSGNIKALPSVGVGQWSAQTGPSTPTFISPTNATTAANVTAYGNYTFKWTETNGSCPAVSDLVQVSYKIQPVANAGANRDTCRKIAFIRAIPSAGSGVWTRVSGPGTVTFGQNNLASTTVTASDYGQYILRWTEDNGPPCSTSFDDIVVNLTPPTKYTLEYFDDRYCGVNDEIFIGVKINGVSPYTFIIESQYSKDTITTSTGYYIYSDNGVTKGASVVTYKITDFKDGNGCGGEPSNNLITIPRKGTDILPVADGFSALNDTLCNSNTGVLIFNYNNTDDLTFYIEDVAHGSTFPVSYQGGAGLVQVPVANLQYGVNKFKINSITKVIGGCEMVHAGVEEVTIVYKPVQFTLVGQNLTCFESGDGSIAITNLVGTPDYTVAFVNTVPSASLLADKFLFNLPAGLYTVKITNAAGCEQSKSVALVQPPKINYTQIVKNPTCYGFTNGSVEIQTSGGSGTLTTYFNGITAQGSYKFISVKAGKYGLKITDNGNGCLLFGDSIVLTQPDSLFLDITAVDVNCDGTENGNFTIEPIGGTLPYTALVSRGAFMQNVPAFYPSANVGLLKQGTYNIRVVDAQGCIVNQQSTIGQGVLLDYKAEKLKDVDCASSGIISITQLSSIPGTLYAIDGSAYGNQTLFQNLAPGNYTIHAKTPAGCIRSFQFTILDKNLPFVTSATELRPATCFNGKDAKIKINISGGSGNYRVIVDGGTPMDKTEFDSLSTGFHRFVIIDINCGFIDTVTYTFNNPGSYSVTVTDADRPSCWNTKDGYIRVVPNGGNVGTFQYSINNGANWQFGNQFPNIGGGNYQVIAKDGKGCISDIFAVNLPAPDTLKMKVVKVDDFPSRTSDITISVVSGGTAPFDYSIDGIQYTSQSVYNDVPFAYINACVRDSEGCRTCIKYALGDVGIGQTNTTVDIAAFPNPSQGIINLDIPANTQVQEITVLNSLGQVAMIVPANSIQNNKIDLSNLENGLYQLLIKTSDSVAVVSVQLIH